MTDQNRSCWIAAVVLGLLVWVFTAGIGDLSWFSGLFLGVITTALFGVFLDWLVCRGAQAVDGIDWDKSAIQQPLMAEGAVKETESPAKPAAAMPVAPAGDAQLHNDGAARPVSTRKDIYGGKSAAVDTAREDKKEDVAKAADEVAGSTPDDLKEIKGIGPKLEELLHENGIIRFAQIAEWSEEELDHFAEVIGRMGGRIRSDDWRSQARILAEGGTTEFSERVEKGDVYV